MKFRFTLQAELNLRTAAADRVGSELAAALRREEQRRHGRSEAEQTLREITRRAQALAAPGTVSPAAVLEIKRCLSGAQAEHDREVHRLEASRLRVEELRQAWTEARRETQALERLRERRLQEYRREQDRRMEGEFNRVVARK
ncbi:MAG: flagellar FliJ family protein [Planctomycetales bacterium]